MSESSFAILTCAHGAEKVVAGQIASEGWRLAFSRPGLVTAKCDRPSVPPPTGVFIRTAMTSIGSVRGETWADLLPGVMQRLNDQPLSWPLDHLHVFPRDRAAIGRFDFEPGVDEVSRLVAETLHPQVHPAYVTAEVANLTASPWQTVLDVVLVDPNHWLLGYHRVASVHDRWPGGVQPIQPTHPPISRAYFKAAEAIEWSGFDLQPGDRAVEIGSAPGGACGRLLEMDLEVMGVDPAEMDIRIARHRRFEHVRARGGDIPRRRYANAKWMLVDSNVRPDQTLVTVQNIVTHDATNFAGLLLTMKIGGYEHADRIAKWRRTIEAWQPKTIDVKHLARNKVEVCFAVGF